MDVAKKAFFENDRPKEIECIRVDGGGDEGPSHHEVQFLWTQRHVTKQTKVTMVTTRCSGDSYLNRVELQNGCLSKGHSNTFIPSTLCGSPYNSEGGLDEQKYKANMSAAVNQYIERVDGTACMKTNIHLMRGAEGHIFTTRRSQLLTFLKGKKEDKEKLRRNNPTLFKYFTEIWQVRNNHIDESFPPNYVFMLKCCGRKGCPQPLCIKGKKNIRKYRKLIIIHSIISRFLFLASENLPESKECRLTLSQPGPINVERAQSMARSMTSPIHIFGLVHAM